MNTLGSGDLPARLRAALAQADFTYDAVAEVLGVRAHAALGRNETTPGLQRTADGSPLETLIRLFLLQAPVSVPAAEAALRDLANGRWERVAELRNILEKAIEMAASQTIFVGKAANRLPNTSCFIAKGWKGETQVMALDLAGFAISAGSACSSGKVKASPVLAALGISDDDARCAVRVSLGIDTTEEQVLRFAQTWTDKHARANARS